MKLIKTAKDEMYTLRRYGILQDDATVFDAATLLKRKKVDKIPIFSADKSEFIGIFKSSHIVQLWLAGKLCKTTKLSAIKNLLIPRSEDYEIVDLDTPLRKLDYSGVLTIVCDNNNKIVGIVP